MVVSSIQQNFSDIQLQSLALNFLEKKNFIVERNKLLTGLSGQEFQVSFHIRGKEGSTDKLSTAIIVLDYAKSIGTDVINKYDRIARDLAYKINKLIIIGNEFSIPARNMSEKAGIFLISRGELVSILVTNQ